MSNTSTIVLKFGGYQPPASVHSRGATVFRDALEKRLGGNIDFQLEGNVVEAGAKAPFGEGRGLVARELPAAAWGAPRPKRATKARSVPELKR